MLVLPDNKFKPLFVSAKDLFVNVQEYFGLTFEKGIDSG